jgi:hypothetical protein
LQLAAPEKSHNLCIFIGKLESGQVAMAFYPGGRRCRGLMRSRKSAIENNKQYAIVIKKH